MGIGLLMTKGGQDVKKGLKRDNIIVEHPLFGMHISEISVFQRKILLLYFPLIFVNSFPEFTPCTQADIVTKMAIYSI